MKDIHIYASATRIAMERGQVTEVSSDYFVTLRQLETLLSRGTEREIESIRRLAITQVLETINQTIGNCLPDSCIKKIWELV